MTNLEKYMQLKSLYGGVADEELKQYLHIVQVMAEEERSYNNHKSKLCQWLSNIERTIKQKAKELEDER